MSGLSLRKLMACRDLNVFLEDDASPEQRVSYLEHMRAAKSCQGIGRWLRPDGRENAHQWVIVPIELEGKHYVECESGAKFKNVENPVSKLIIVVQVLKRQYGS